MHVLSTSAANSAGRMEGTSTPGSYLHKLHVAEDVDRVVRCVEVVAATAQLGVAAPKVTALTVGGLGAVQPAAARRGAVYCRR